MTTRAQSDSPQRGADANYVSRRLRVSTPHQDAIWEQGVNELNVVAVDGKRIRLADGRELVEFMSCSYLGLDQRLELRQAAHAAIDSFGVQVSTARTRMRASYFGELEELLTSINHGWRAVTFGSVSAAHLAAVPILAAGELKGYPLNRGGAAFVLDRSAHASLQSLRGIMEQFGPVVRADFSDGDLLASLCREIAASGRTVIAMCDSVGSMGGTTNVSAVSAIMAEVDGIAYFDDAHGTSVFGSKGQGYVLAGMNGTLPHRTIWTGSLSKAFGATGGFVAVANDADASFLKRYAIPYAFGGPPSLPGVAAAVASARLHLDGTVERLQVDMRANLVVFDQLMTHNTINAGSSSPIRGVLVGEEFAAIAAAEAVQAHGYAVTTAMYPTVALGQAMIRMAVSASHTKDDIGGLAEAVDAAVAR